MEITVDETGRHERRGRVEVEIKGKFPEIDLHLGALRSSEERLGWQVECHHRPRELFGIRVSQTNMNLGF